MRPYPSSALSPRVQLPPWMTRIAGARRAVGLEGEARVEQRGSGAVAEVGQHVGIRLRGRPRRALGPDREHLRVRRRWRSPRARRGPRSAPRRGCRSGRRENDAGAWWINGNAFPRKTRYRRPVGSRHRRSLRAPLVRRAGRITSASVGEEFLEENGPGRRLPGFSSRVLTHALRTLLNTGKTVMPKNTNGAPLRATTPAARSAARAPSTAATSRMPRELPRRRPRWNCGRARGQGSHARASPRQRVP